MSEEGLLLSSCDSVMMSTCASPLVARRFQSADASDKKYHCSVCKKPFRLERAAQVHIAQAHAGSGTVEAGAGPGFVGEAPRTPPPSNAPPSAPTARPVAPQQDFHGEDEEDRKYRNRVAPKPLHQPTVDVPAKAMEEMLAVWDKIGVSRLEGFVHSSMVMKVYTMAQGSGSSGYNIDVPTSGENPFAQLKDMKLASSTGKGESKSAASQEEAPEDIPIFDMTKAFAPAPEAEHSPFVAAAVINPFLKTGSTLKISTEKKPQVKAEVPQVPVTPYGQLPVFGTAIECRPKAPLANNEEGNPQATSRSETEQTPPLASGVTVASPFGGGISSPFVGVVQQLEQAAASPFPLDTLETSTAAASPFAAGAAASPFAAGGTASFGTPSSDPSALFSAATPVKAASEEAKKFVCSHCGKAFRSLFDLGSHMKDKHNIAPAEGALKAGMPKKRQLPDLPAFVPSPVDLAATSPFGSPHGSTTSWAEASLQLHTCAATNITIVGSVVEIQSSTTEPRCTVLGIAVKGDDGDEDEVFTVKCFGESSSAASQLQRRQTVLVSGTLRLLPHQDGISNRFYVTPIVHVTPSVGMMSVVE